MSHDFDCKMCAQLGSEVHDKPTSEQPSDGVQGILDRHFVREPGPSEADLPVDWALTARALAEYVDALEKTLVATRKQCDQAIRQRDQLVDFADDNIQLRAKIRRLDLKLQNFLLRVQDCASGLERLNQE